MWTNLVRIENELIYSCNKRGWLWIQWLDFEDGLKKKIKQLLPQSIVFKIKQFRIARRRARTNQMQFPTDSN